ncbi:MAG: NAD-binding protein [Bacteroidota bacterium]
MPKASLKERLRYSFENTLSRGTIAIIFWLAVISTLIVIIAGCVIAFAGVKPEDSEQLGFIEAAWQSLMRTLDAGNLAGDLGWGYRAIMFCVTIGGIFIISSLIGTLTSGLESKLDEMRKGRSKVLESNHTLILGWSSKVFSIISELLIANENQKKPRIVIMADKDKVEMEDEIRSRFPDTKNTKIICRTGSPLDLNDLEVASPHDARSIIILSPEEGQNPDTHVIKSILAITNNPNRKKEKYHIVAEIREEANMEAARLVSNDEAVLVLAGDLIARVTAQTCRQSGLSVVYTELLDFDGAEIYFKDEPSLAGKTYKDALNAYEESAVMGLFHQDGSVSINPPMDKKIEAGDKLIAISEDDDTIVLSNKKDLGINTAALSDGAKASPRKESTLILGWNDKGLTIIRELDNYVAEGSEVVVVTENDGPKEDLDRLKQELKKQNLKFVKGSTTERALLDSLGVTSFNHIIILCYSDMDLQEADAKTLITLLHLRNISEQTGHDFSIVSEMLDMRNRELAEVTKADDFIVSDKLISLMLSQLSENKHLQRVFDDLFAAEGSEVYLKPATDYVKAGQEINFYTIIESAARKGETAIGYRIAAFASDPEKAYGVAVNPKKSARFRLGENDKVIVLAED